MNKTNLTLNILHKEILSELREKQPYQYFKFQWNKQEQARIEELIAAGIVFKLIQRIPYQGRFSTKVTLSINAGWL